jgi:hypothetical protein
MYYPNIGELHLIANGLANDADFRVRLFTNDITPGEFDTLTNYTEASFTGYSSLLLVRAGAAAIDDGGYAAQAYDRCTFEMTGSAETATIYGFTLDHTGTLICAHRFEAAPIYMDDTSPTLHVDITITCRSEE